MKYDAFISYRHTPLDMEIAKKLHRGLETFSIPVAVQKKTGKKKIRRVFRDQEELPIGSNLTEEINAALEESEYLIVVCSPNTPGSEWVQKEIETFTSLHGHSRVLAILIDGEPEDSFPPMLLSDGDGNPVEPLAADIRGANRTERNRKFKTELLRLVAPLIGCSFDDLRQRHRERIVRKAIAYVSATALLIGGAGAAFGIYNASIAREMEEMNQQQRSLTSENTRLAMDYMQENRDRQINQSRFYAEEAMRLLSKGRRREAALIACEALPTDGNNRPYVAEAEYALSSALHAYDDGVSRSHYKALEHELPVMDYWNNNSGNRLITQDHGNNIHIWDTDSWEECACIAPEIRDDNRITRIQTAYADDDRVYILTDKKFNVYDYSGQLEYSVERPGIYDYSGATFSEEEGIAFLTTGRELQIIRLSDGSIVTQYENDQPGFYNSKQTYYADLGLFIVGHNSVDESAATLTLLHAEENDIQSVTLSSEYLIQFCITPAGNIAVLSSISNLHLQPEPEAIYLDLFSPTGEKLWTQSFIATIDGTSSYKSLIKSHTYPVENGERTGIVCILEDEAFTFDEADGRIVMSMNLPGNAESLLLDRKTEYGIIAYNTDIIQSVDLETGKPGPILEGLNVDNLRDLIVIDGDLIARAVYDKNVYVFSFQKAPDLEDLPAIKDNMYSVGTSSNGNYYVMNRGSAYEEYEFYDPDGNMIYSIDINGYIVKRAFLNDSFILATREGINFIDPIAKKEESISNVEMGIDAALITGANFSQNGEYAVFWENNNTYLVDLKTKSCLYHLETKTNIGCAIPFENGKEILISQTGRNLYIVNTENGEAQEFESELLRETTDYYDMCYLTLSGNGRYAAMHCMDQKVRIIDLQNGTLSEGFPMQLTNSSFLQFSDDGRHLFLQGDDHIFKIWDIAANQYIDSFDTDYPIRYAIPDEEDGKIALLSGYSLYMLDTRDYGLCAEVPDCIAYSKITNCFIQYDRGSVWRCYYKDYQTLIEETGRQFPGAELSNAERVDYNID